MKAFKESFQQNIEGALSQLKVLEDKAKELKASAALDKIQEMRSEIEAIQGSVETRISSKYR